MPQIGHILPSPIFASSFGAVYEKIYKEALDYQKREDWGNSDKCYLNAICAAEKSLRSRPNNFNLNRNLAEMHFDYGCSLEAQRRPAEAKGIYQKAYEYGHRADEQKHDVKWQLLNSIVKVVFLANLPYAQTGLYLVSLKRLADARLLTTLN